MSKRRPIQPGDEIALQKGVIFRCPPGRQNNRTAVVQRRMDEYAPGALYLTGDLHGCRYWNEDSVRVVRRAKP